MGVSNNTEWTECDLFINTEWLTKETEKAWMFMLWEKRRMVFPKKLIQRFNRTSKMFVITMPKWFVEKNGIKYLMDEEVRLLLFPSKKPKAFHEKVRSMFEQDTKPSDILSPGAPSATTVPKPDNLPNWW